MEKLGRPVAFRPHQRIRERLEQAQRAGFDMSLLINELLDANLDEHLASKIRERLSEVEELREALNAPNR